MSFHFITFGGPLENFHKAASRLATQAKNFKMFDSISVFTETELKNDLEFWQQHGKWIEEKERGYGYYIWKFHLILKKLSTLQDGALLLYLDSGCELNIEGQKKMQEYVDLTRKHNIIFTSTNSTDITHTKMDLVHKVLGEKYCLDHEDTVRQLLKIPQMQSGCLFMKNCMEIRDLLAEINELCQEYHFIDDSPSVAQNDPSFIEHRHDQSVMNLVMKKNGYINSFFDPSYFAPDWNYYGMTYPLWACRNRTGVSQIIFTN